MFQSFTTHKQFLPKPLLFAAVFGVMVFAAFSPVFSQMTEAQTKNVCFSQSANLCSPVPFPDEGACDTGCSAIFGDGSCVAISSCPGGVQPVQSTLGKDIGGIAMSGLFYALTWILQHINGMLVILITLFAQLFDATVAISLAGLSGINAVTIGWTITRDIANIFFIFVLLIIAIATILRLESYGAKQLLPKLIIMALLINFSLVIAFTVVDASNILALAFIKEISRPTISTTIATVLKLGKITDVTSIAGEHRDIDPTNSLSAGMETVIKTQLNQEFTTDKDITNATPASPSPEDNQLIQFFWQATILILQLTLMFVFVALSVMLLVRSVALIIIFVLAPLGFLAAILPATRSYANQWWHKLFQWSFFFPASAFMIYLAIAYGAQMSQVLNGAGGNQVINTGILFNYFATVAFLMGSLVVAKQMGIVGAAAAIGIGLGLAKKARGYAGKTSLAAAGGVASVTGIRAAGRKIGDKAGTMLEGRAGRIPVLRSALSRVSASRDKAISEELKGVSHLSPAALANMSTGPTGLTAAASAQAFNKLKPEDQRKFANAMGKVDKEGKPTNDAFTKFAASAEQFGVKKATLAKASGDTHQAMQILHPEYRNMASEPAGDATYQGHVDDFLDNLTTKEIGLLSTATVQNSDAFREYMLKSSKDLKEVFTKREHIEAFSKNLNNYALTLPAISSGLTSSKPDAIATEIEKMGNKELAAEFRRGSVGASNIGVNLVLNSDNIKLKTRRGVVTTVTAEGD